ncbi:MULTISPECIES: cytochrome P450 [Enterobacter]|uniref:Cytochrome P450 n=3 Tax=Enterobacter kobei TaxID=208224 RepID=A0ABX9F0B2_9ENTR|nr:MULTISPECIES: cytochrome P450 [Enterobacter]EKS6746676.1 cytochrome P450 [Enterobacter kobei]EKV5790685.1 cytochrome P450 [Enterobacter kobei]ELC0993727.1 cytochrome P450 [Enterobacter kobei]ELE6989048.1 cytochrome P450 [Enterobacter kobei]ELE9687903.1 cytochrome P450 [Enterobacter kobei]
MAYVEKALRFNPASPVFQENLHNVYHHMRNHQPVARIGKTWVLTRYQDVYQTLKERAFVSSGIPEDVHSEMEKECFSLSPPIRDLLYGIVLFEDGNVHRAHRQALQALFTGESWAALTQLISDESHTLVAELTTTGTIDGIRQIAAPLWGKLFTAWLNLPEAQQEVVEQEKSAIRLLLDPSAIDREGLQRLIVALSRLDDSFRQLAQAHSQGYDSLFYRSLLKGYGGDRDALATRFSTDCVTMLIGGSETSEALTGNLAYMLAQHPELQARVRNNTLRMRDVVSETMRFESPLQMGRRKVVAPVQFLGRELKAGDNILVCLGSANRDESVFEEAWRFIPGRKNAQRQLGFGAGVHQCIGQLLAQCQAETLAMALCERGTLSLDGEAKWSTRSLILRTLETLPVKIT